MSGVHIDSFSGALADLPQGQRDHITALRVLDRSPRVSTFACSEWPWLGALVTDLVRSGLVVDDKASPYPFHRFTLTAAGREMLALAGATPSSNEGGPT